MKLSSSGQISLTVGVCRPPACVPPRSRRPDADGIAEFPLVQECPELFHLVAVGLRLARDIVSHGCGHPRARSAGPSQGK